MEVASTIFVLSVRDTRIISVPARNRSKKGHSQRNIDAQNAREDPGKRASNERDTQRVRKGEGRVFPMRSSSLVFEERERKGCVYASKQRGGRSFVGV